MEISVCQALKEFCCAVKKLNRHHLNQNHLNKKTTTTKQQFKLKPMRHCDRLFHSLYQRSVFEVKKNLLDGFPVLLLGICESMKTKRKDLTSWPCGDCGVCVLFL